MNRNTAIIVTVVVTLLCGCPGLFSACFGLMFAGISQVPNADLDVMGRTDPNTALAFGIGMLCVGVVGVIIAALVGFLTLRNSRPPAAQ